MGPQAAGSQVLSRFSLTFYLNARTLFESLDYVSAITKFLIAISAGYLLFTSLQCKTGNGNLKHLHYDRCFTISGFVVTGFYCIPIRDVPKNCFSFYAKKRGWGEGGGGCQVEKHDDNDDKDSSF